MHVPAAAPAREGVPGEQSAAARADVQPACAHDRAEPRAHLLYSYSNSILQYSIVLAFSYSYMRQISIVLRVLVHVQCIVGVLCDGPEVTHLEVLFVRSPRPRAR